MKNLKPIQRSRIRLIVGKLYYTIKRYLEWYTNGTRYSKTKVENLLPYTAFNHKSILLRKLKNVDMWMQFNKVVNLGIAVKRLDGILIQPGETFSYWKLIGKPSRRKGYVNGMILFNGGFTSGVGGGLCQLSNLIYWMTLHTPLQVTERYRHSYDVFPDANRTQPFGSGATCVYNYRDLQIYNDTDQPYQLHVYLSDEYLHGEWRTTGLQNDRYEVYERTHFISHEFWGGYVRHNELGRRIFTKEGELVKDEHVTENHALMMYQPFLEERITQ